MKNTEIKFSKPKKKGSINEIKYWKPNLLQRFIYWAAINKIDFDTSKDIDFGNYYHAANDWSNGSGNKKLDWLATISSWIKRDIRENKVKVKKATDINKRMKV